MRTPVSKSWRRLDFRKLWLLMGIVCAAPVAAQQAPTDVPPGHWAYEAIQELANKGLILGYPDGKFLGNRTLTRYEMATIIQRLLAHIQQIQPAAPPPTPPPPTPPPPTPAPGVTPEQLAEIRRLVDEFRVELTVIGTDMKAVKERLDALEKRTSDLEKQVTDPKGAIQTTVANVARLRRLLFSGYVQARYEAFENSEEGTSIVDRFTLRRVRLTASARPTDAIAAKIQAEFNSTAGNAPTSSPSSANVALRDAWIDWFIKDDPARGPIFTIGQMKWPFGYEVTQSSSVRETPERARWSTELFNGERDRGVKIGTASGKSWLLEVGGYNGTGINTNDNNNEKDVVGRLRYTFGEALTVGASGYSGEALFFTPATGTTPASSREFVKYRYGADFQLLYPRFRIQGEYVTARERGREPWGWDAQVVFGLDRSAKTQLVAKYDEYDSDGLPVSGYSSTQLPGKVGTWNLGLIHYLDPSTRLKLFYQIADEEDNSIDNNLATVELIALF